MKKILLILALLVTIIPYSYAGTKDTCIQESQATAPGLILYQKNLNTILVAMTNTISSQDKSKQKNIVQTSKENKQQVQTIFSQITTWEGYSSTFNYQIGYPLFHNLSYSVKRDYQGLETQREKLNRFLYFLATKGYGNIPITNICNNIDGACDISDTTLLTLGWQLVKNHNNIMASYREIVTGKISSQQEVAENLYLIPTDTFWWELINTYSPEATKQETQNCGTFKAILRSIEKIEFLNPQKEKKWIDLWKYQWSRATGRLDDASINKQREREQDILSQELTKQGIPQDRHGAMIESLNDFNQKSGYSENNNPIDNSFRDLSNSIQREWSSFYESVAKDFVDNDEKTTIESLYQTQNEADIDTQIRFDIQALYQYSLPSAISSQRQASELRGKLVEIHNSLNLSNQILQSTCKRAVASCQEQNTGVWKCWQCQ